MSGRFSSARRPKRLSMEPLETREVPATFAVDIHDDPFFFDTNLVSVRQPISLADANPGLDASACRPGPSSCSFGIGPVERSGSGEPGA